MIEDKCMIGSHTIKGDRNYQQDMCAYDWRGSMLLAVVCDGMGGMEDGDIASRIGVQLALDMFRDNPPPDIYGAAEWMKTVFISADTEIADLKNKNGKPVSSGSTEIMVMIEKDRMQWGCVGDSRIYLKRGKTLKVITRMHNYNLTLDKMLNSGQITTGERMRMGAGKGEFLISYLGIGGLPIIDIGTLVTLEEGDMIILCSDGVYKALDDLQVNAILEECGGNAEIASHRIVDEAYRLSRKKRISEQDNTTAIVIRYTERRRLF